jgi:HNH endonuclease
MGIQERNRLKRIRADVVERDGSICCYCDLVLLPEQITMEHICPDSHRGTFNATNLTVACAPCNQRRGNRPFFEYVKQFNWHQDKLDKYQRLYFANLKIKVLNIAKEHVNNGHVIPSVIIKKACKQLKIKEIDFVSYQEEYCLNIVMDQACHWTDIKFDFVQLIRIIEMESK